MSGSRGKGQASARAATRRRSLLAVAVAVGVGAVADASAQNVFVEVSRQQQGQGLLTHFGTRCVVITAQHVLGGSTFASYAREGPGAPPVFMKLARSFPFDVAVLEPDVPVTSCALDLAELGAAGPLDSALTLRQIEESGLMLQHPVTVRSDDGIMVTVAPADGGGFTAGMSGGALVMDGQPVAMMLAVEGGAGEAEAIRLDVAARWMVPFLRPRPVAALEPEPAVVGDLLSDPDAGADVQVTAGPVDDSSAPLNLIAGPSVPWRGRIVSRPVEVSITLAGADTQEIRCVMVEPGPDTPPDAMPRTVAVHYRIGAGNWRQAGWGEPSLTEGDFALSMSVLADAIKLQLGDPSNGSPVLEIGRIAVLSQPCAG